MATRKECDQYAAELNERFETLIRWAIQQWPHKNYPLLLSDFTASRREISTIIGPKLGDGETESASTPRHTSSSYVSTTPMPWP